MKMIKKLPTAKETLEIINKQWVTIDELMELTGLGRNSCYYIKKEINDQLEKEGHKVLDCYVPSDRLIVYLNINIDYLKKVSDIIEEQE